MVSHAIFLDSADIGEIRDAVGTGLVGGIATNPDKIARSGKSYGKVLEEIRAFFDGPVSFQALGRTLEELTAHAREIHGMDSNLAVKIAADKTGLTAIRALVSEGIRTNATLIFNPAQALLAGLAGSPFISPFIGRAMMSGHDGVGAIGKMRGLFDAWGITGCAIVAASIKDVDQAIEAVLAGAHSLAVPYAVFEAMMAHPLCAQGIERFLADFDAVRKRERRR
jgi:transaldolase